MRLLHIHVSLLGDNSVTGPQTRAVVYEWKRAYPDLAVTYRALAEQATATDQISKETERVTKLITAVTRAVAEQAAGTSQITTSAEQLRVQAEQAARALQEQSRGVRDLTTASRNIAKQVKLISDANLQHSTGAERVVKRLQEIRAVAEHNTADAQLMHTETARLSKAGGRGKAVLRPAASKGSVARNGTPPN